jgi:hypothetical protein
LAALVARFCVARWLQTAVRRAAPAGPLLDADVAQLVEQLIRNQQVTRSSRVVGSKIPEKLVDPGRPIVGLARTG